MGVRGKNQVITLFRNTPFFISESLYRPSEHSILKNTMFDIRFSRTLFSGEIWKFRGIFA